MRRPVVLGGVRQSGSDPMTSTCASSTRTGVDVAQSLSSCRSYCSSQDFCQTPHLYSTVPDASVTSAQIRYEGGSGSQSVHRPRWPGTASEAQGNCTP